MFDSQPLDPARKPASIPFVDAAQKARLLGQAAKERQFETINFRTGKLKFDDIEPEQGMKMLAVFWTRQHATGSIVYRPCFMRDMASKGPYFSSLLLNAILFVAAKGLPPVDGMDICHRGVPWRQKIERELYDPEAQLLCKSRVTTIQALLLFSDALFSWFDERSLSWHYLGIAINMIIDLGLHTQNATTASGVDRSSEELETHRRVFWAAYVLDKIQSIYQGRPPRLRDADCRVPLLFVDEYEEFEPFDPVGYSGWLEGEGQPIHGVSTFEELCKLCIIADRILCTVYAETSHERDPKELLDSARLLHNELRQWRRNLPPHLSIQMSPSGYLDRHNGCVALPHTLCLLLMFHALTILLERPFSSDGHLRSTTGSSSANTETASICANEASQIHILLRWYKRHYCCKSPPYFLSYATYVSATIHARVVARNPRDLESQQCLRNCLEILTVHTDVCYAPRRAMSILLGLLRRLKIDVGALSGYTGANMALLGMVVGHRIDTDALGAGTSLGEDLSSLMLPSQLGTAGLTGIENGNTGSTDWSQMANSMVNPYLNENSGDAMDHFLPESLFDFDPLFGFDGFNMDTLSGSFT
ncbi:hypothetical protein P280DRAFT_390513 [Massarina eburnea CBS 473.64]|uniref:Xylanolytic transcriptional activator regulatory domain-containing protein n=1 Tax=Massarina eburnea CBS 473.64 TaxID=1395130 RepID=A0A6A6SAW9_9PLEO|nr:hypothetical protein P280DRAFT_390513 [Massarina eburnea CBS 473.64]